jgi:hypothetical protein
VAANQRDPGKPTLFEEIEELEEALVERCLELLEQTETIRDLTNYHWWPQAA